ncbi:MAG: hypothetical protein EZS28_048642 [Streblomastix strix]|uniref:Uncharacterized protein n=1 Tax=Streblomastix strix TaxID=222440 RepID=A0A5J4TD25_9EUKA|nr:MAG: hypothetical protein EZS28_048642 [Streblomastix strix]
MKVRLQVALIQIHPASKNQFQVLKLTDVESKSKKKFRVHLSPSGIHGHSGSLHKRGTLIYVWETIQILREILNSDGIDKAIAADYVGPKEVVNRKFFKSNQTIK